MLIWAVMLCLSAVVFAIWIYEPRSFLYVFQRLAYRVYDRQNFLSNVSRYFPEQTRVADSIELIRAELMALLTDRRVPKAHEMDPLNNEISFAQGPGWRTFYLKVYSGWFKDNCARCPYTYELFKPMRNVLTVMFSIMEPGNVIPPHAGKLRGFLRYQLPIVVPASPGCAITVNGETRVYEAGKGFMFDDNLVHSVTNATSEYRLVLFLDIYKPANILVRAVDGFFMQLVALSPKFRAAAGRAYKEF